MAEIKQPTSIGIILDGNRRWAKVRGLPTLEGHRQGLDNVKPVVLSARDKGIKHVALFMFSTENWNRTKEEVSYLLDLFETMARDKAEELLKENIAVRFVGQTERFSSTMQTLMRSIEEKNPKNPDLTVWACLSYGGRAEIVEAARAAAQAGEVTEESLEGHMWTGGMPDVDILIRTSGEMRTSGFLTWKSVYAELFFIDKMWPEFNNDDLGAILDEYAARERRMGK